MFRDSPGGSMTSVGGEVGGDEMYFMCLSIIYLYPHPDVCLQLLAENPLTQIDNQENYVRSIQLENVCSKFSE